MSNRTPGPWEVKKDGDNWRIRQKGSVKRRVGFTVERPVGESFQEKYDAILAAAAPDLLGALEAMVFSSVVHGYDNDSVVPIARDAIARAKGEQV